MSIKTIFEQTIKSLKDEEQREIAVIKERVTKEQIIPYNQDMDIARDKAIAELQENLNVNIVSMQEKFAKDRQNIIDANEKKKSDNATSVIATETYSVQMKYEKAIAKVKEQLENQKE